MTSEVFFASAFCIVGQAFESCCDKAKSNTLLDYISFETAVMASEGNLCYLCVSTSMLVNYIGYVLLFTSRWGKFKL